MEAQPREAPHPNAIDPVPSKVGNIRERLWVNAPRETAHRDNIALADRRFRDCAPILARRGKGPAATMPTGPQCRRECRTLYVPFRLTILKPRLPWSGLSLWPNTGLMDPIIPVVPREPFNDPALKLKVRLHRPELETFDPATLVGELRQRYRRKNGGEE